MDTVKVESVVVGFHPSGYRIDKTAEPVNYYTKWDLIENHWKNPKPVSFHNLPQKGWIPKDKFDWEKTPIAALNV